MNKDVMFGRATDEWRTPQATFDALNAEFGFDVDAAATAENTWLPMWFGLDAVPGGFFYDALAIDWSEYGRTFWLNPPYSKCREFIAKAAEEARKGLTVVCLVPSRTDTRYWHEHVWNVETNQPREGVEIRFLKGRLKFGNSTNSAPFPSVVIIFRPPTAASVAA
jgi:phage N-6-adenine-methyltransferase